MIKKFLAVMIFLLSLTNCAAASSELEETEIRMICAICSMGAYSDEDSHLMNSMVTERGWKIETLSHKNNRANAKAYLVSKGDIKILTIAGTESWKDVEVDLRVGRVRLNEDDSAADKEKITNDEIFLHRGFRDYTDVVFGDGLTERLINSLEENPYETLYITGHSLGGAVATIAAIRLTDAGIPKDRLKVITFAAPAVGSQALANAYEDKIDLTRILMKGDVIKKSLQKLGYVQFGKVLEYQQSAEGKHFEHLMSLYLDCAIRDYLNAGGNFRHDAQNKIDAPIYVAPVLIVKGGFKDPDTDPVWNTLDDGLTNHFRNLTFADELSREISDKNLLDNDFNEFVSAAKENGCKYVLVRVLSAKKIRNVLSGGRHVTLEETVLDADDGFVLFMQTSGASTNKLTMLEAVLSAQENLNEDLRNFFRNK